jgi:hypothetical protein
MPSHRFPSLSGDGRYIFFSSDAGGQGGLIFGNSNQISIPATDNNRRDIFLRDMKSFSTPQSNATITIKLDIFEETNFIIPQFEEMPVIVNVHLDQGYVESASLYVDNQLINSVDAVNLGLNTAQIIIPWVNIRQGNSLFSVVIQDNFGNLFHSSQYSVKVVSRDKELMGMNLILNPSVNNIFRFGSDANVTRGSSIGARFISTNSRGKLSDLKEVVFFLNGKKIKTDITPPYFVNFTPPSYAEDNSTYLWDWVLSVKAVSLSGSSRMEHRFGKVQDIIFPPFPASNLKIISNLIKDKNGMVYQGLPVELEVSLIGSSDSLTNAQQQHFFANGIHFFSAQPNMIFDSNGNLNGVKYYAKFDVDYEKFAKPNGDIELFAFGDLSSINTTPIFKSNSILLSASNSLPWVDPITNALNLFDEFSDSNLTGNHIKKFEDILDQNTKPIVEWIQYLTEIGDFDKRIDIHSAYHITNANWHDSYVHLEKDLNLWTPIDSN